VETDSGVPDECDEDFNEVVSPEQAELFVAGDFRLA
jgi:hypothetical protein